MSNTISKLPHDLLRLCQKHPPEIFLVLGSGYGSLAEKFQNRHSWPFSQFPEISATTVPGHKGCITYAQFNKKKLLISEGRVHAYEGYTRQVVTATTRIAHFLGCHTCIFTNAAGGISPSLNPGSIMLIKNHIDTISNVWNIDKTNPGFLSPSPSPYDPTLIDKLKNISKSQNLSTSTGTYLMVTGPNYESASEIRAFSSWKADAVGMSTAWEVETGFRLGMKCAGISGITNKAAGLSHNHPSHQEVLENAKELTQSFEKLLFSYLESL
ncbi:MAG: purine-nucleoside phosphorylase [Planctomycetes bacterium]|nr:purine-nucleoside phosphorylase [Planctomycetota bacterium]